MAEPASGVRADPRPPAVVHVDLDGVTDIFAAHGWAPPTGPDRLFETGLQRCLDFFDRHGVRATLFVIASSLADPRKRALVAEAVARGHELASHTVTHRPLTTLGPADKREELAASRAQIEDAFGVQVAGFRAPGYRIDRATYELLAELGYEWDGSAFPTPAFATALQEPVERLREIRRPVDGFPFVAVPMPDHRPLPLPFSASYVLTLDRVGLGLPLFTTGLRRFHRTGRPFVCLFHLIDFADPMPAPLALRQRVFTLSMTAVQRKMEVGQRILGAVADRYRVMTTNQLMAEVRAAGAL